MTILTAGPDAATGWPRRRLLLALLVVSLALNLFFVAGAAWTRWNAAPQRLGPAEHFQQIAAQLDLDPQQRAAFDAYTAAMRTRFARMREQLGPLIGAAWEEIAKPQPDTAQIGRLFDQAAEKRREFQRETTTQTLNLLAVLTSTQRAKFVALVRERRSGWQRAHPAER